MPATATKINPDIAKERATASFDVEEFAVWWHGSAKKLKEYREIVEIILTDPELVDEFPSEYVSFQDQYDNAIRKSTLLATKLKKLQEKRNPGGNDIYPQLFIESFVNAIIPEGSSISVHIIMFTPAIEKQGSPEQVEKWLPRARKCEILGTYAQTELSHGTFIRGIQTRADYDPRTEEFILNTPSITGYKWWPAGLGHSVNYAVVVAQLYIRDKNHGIQMFIVQLRDEETHMPLPGIHIGDIGNKLGFKGVNNGFLGFKNVRIPRMQMLMRNAQVHADGTFTSSPASVLTYWTMVYVRSLILIQAYGLLAQAATIATRYSAVRRQGLINPKQGQEHQIMDHITQQLKIFPEISKSIVIRLGADYLYEMYLQVTEEISESKFDRLGEIHALASCLKAISTNDSSAGIETLRLACGGHGYMLASNLPNLYGLATAAATYEGENTVMFLQTSRFLMKAWAKALKGTSLIPTVAYLEEAVRMEKFPKWDGSLECMVKALQFIAANKIRLAYNHLMERINRGMTPEEAANETSIELTQAAELHGRSFLATTAWRKLFIETSHRSGQLNKVLLDILELYLISACFRNMSDIVRFIKLTDENVSGLQSSLEQTLSRLRPNAVAIVDGFDYHDRMLNSVLGHYDGNVYERIFASAQKSPMNNIPVQKSFHEFLKPFLKSNM